MARRTSKGIKREKSSRKSARSGIISEEMQEY